jgi:sec-independent protein translocase protein TatA
MTRKIEVGCFFHQVFRLFFSRVGKGCYIRRTKEAVMPGMGELIVILLIVLVVFGANKLPGIGDALGRSIKNFKKASAVDGQDDDEKDAKAAPKQVAAKTPSQIEEGAADDDGEWEEVVVRRKKKVQS